MIKPTEEESLKDFKKRLTALGRRSIHELESQSRLDEVVADCYQSIEDHESMPGVLSDNEVIELCKHTLAEFANELKDEVPHDKKAKQILMDEGWINYTNRAYAA